MTWMELLALVLALLAEVLKLGGGDTNAALKPEASLKVRQMLLDAIARLTSKKKRGT